MSQSPSIVFVVDDDFSIRESLELLLRHEGLNVETFSSAQEFLNRPRADVPSCLVLDVSLPGLNGLELQKRLAPERHDMPIIFVTGCGDVPITVHAMKAGAVEFLTKPLREEILLNAIHDALERSKVLMDRDAEIQRLKARYARLTSREREVMVLVVAGLLNKQVGGELGISEVTVKAHRGSMMRKMEAESLSELIGIAARLRLLRPAPTKEFLEKQTLRAAPSVRSGVADASLSNTGCAAPFCADRAGGHGAGFSARGRAHTRTSSTCGAGHH
jgi:FixJ family two-component response regulator